MNRELFFENARLLNSLSITPLMYGSLGLEYLTGKNLNADDIDILIPEIFISAKWNEFRDTLEDKGYVLTDEHEHTFCKNGVSYSYASIEELETFAGISVADTKVCCKDRAWFRTISLEQYLEVYKASSKDGYRINVRKKKDNKKIRLIEEYISHK